MNRNFLNAYVNLPPKDFYLKVINLVLKEDLNINKELRSLPREIKNKNQENMIVALSCAYYISGMSITNGIFSHPDITITDIDISGSNSDIRSTYFKQWNIKATLAQEKLIYEVKKIYIKRKILRLNSARVALSLA